MKEEVTPSRRLPAEGQKLHVENEPRKKAEHEHRRAEAALKKSEQRYRELFDNMKSGVAVYEATADGGDFIIRDFNQAAERIEQIKRQDLIGKSVLAAFPGINDLGLFEVFQRVWETGQPEWHSNGFYKDKRIAGWRENYVYKLPSGEIVAVYDDITARKEAELALEKSEERFRAVFEKAAVGICMISPEGGYLWVNPHLCGMWGYTQEELRKMHYSDMAHPDDLKASQEIFHGLSGGGTDTHTRERRYIRKDGSVIWCNLTVSFIRDAAGRHKYSVAVVEDITERKKAENALKESEERYRATFELAPLGVGHVNAQGRYILVNQRLCEILGYSPRELTKLKYTDVTFPPDVKKGEELWGKLWKGEIQKYSREKRYLRKDGSVVWINITASLVRDAAGRPRYQISLMEDITERKKADEALKESEERFRDLARFLPETIFELDRQGNLTFVNEQAFGRFGYTRRDFEKGLTGLDMIAPQDRPRAQQNMAKILAGQDLGLNEYQGLRKEGTTFPALIHSMPIIKNGEAVGLRGFIIDITNRKKALEDLRKSEEKYRFITEKATDVIWQTDLEGNFQFFSPAFEQLTGWSMEESLSLNLKDVMTPDSYQRTAQVIKEKIAVGGNITKTSPRPTIISVRALRKDGSYYIAEVTARLLRDEAGRPVGITGITRDITERKQNEEALKKLTQDLQKRLKELNCLFEVSNLLGETDKSLAEALVAVISLLPPAFCHPDEACARITLDNHQYESPDFKETEFKLSSAISLGGKAIGALEVFCPAENTAAPQGPFIKEEILLLEVIAKRISEWMERRQAEQERQKVETQLRQAQKMEALGTLAGGIAHDFNNILAAIMGFSEIALQNAKTGISNTKEIGQVLAAASRAGHLIRQILTFSRKVEAQLRPLDLNRVVTQAVKLLKRTIPKMVSIELVLAKDLKLITGDAIQMEQVLVNLATNAIDAMPDGGRFIIQTKNLVLDDKFCTNHVGVSPGPYVLCQVTDTGTGMDEKTLRHIFDPFFTTKEVGKGTGLGLSTVYGIVKNHGGTIICYSHPGQGTDFKIYLPLLPSGQAESFSDVKASSEFPKGSETILVVDDEETLRSSTQEILKRGGYKILTADSAERALKIVQEKPDVIDLVLLDVGMPGMGGIKGLPELKKISPQIKVLLASGYAVEGALKQVLAASPAGFISKPYRLSELLNKVREILDAKD